MKVVQGTERQSTVRHHASHRRSYTHHYINPREGIIHIEWTKKVGTWNKLTFGPWKRTRLP